MRPRWGMISLVGGLVTVAFVTGGWLSRPEPAATDNVYQQARLFEDMLSAIRAHYVDSISEPELYFRATSGTVDHLRDPYSVLLVGDDYKRYTERLSGTADGLGLQLDLRGQRLVVVGATPGSAAERDGVQAGDHLLTVNGEPTKGWNVERTATRLRAEAGDTVTITVARQGLDAPVTYRLVSGPLHVPAASPGLVVTDSAGSPLADSVGVVALSVVSAGAAEELTRSVDALYEQGIRRLVLDLRSNPGGVLSQGIALAELFLDEGRRVGTMQGRTERQTTVYTAEREQRWPDLDVALLVNGATASAAEILAGALQDHDRAVVVGSPTLGKGAVQGTIPLGRDVAVKLTTARWLTPSGRGIQRPLPGLDIAPDSASRFRTESGRPLPDASGILPDVPVEPRRMGPAERALRLALGGDLSGYRDALAAYAADLRDSGTVTGEEFAVSPAMLREVRRRLERESIRVPPGLWRDADEVVARDLGEEIARAVGGDDAVRRRRLSDDRQLWAAVAVLQAPPAADSVAVDTTTAE